MSRISWSLLFSLFLIVLWVVLWKVASSWVGYVAVSFVFIGVVGETLADLFEIPQNEEKRRALAKYSALILIVGLAGDICDLWINDQAIEELKGKLADRTLTDEQVENVVSKVWVFLGQEYKITTYEDLREALALANRIHESLQIARWKYIKPTGWSTLIPGVEGVSIYVHPKADGRTHKAAKELVAILVAEGIFAEKRDRNDPGNPDNILQINVGMKPQ